MSDHRFESYTQLHKALEEGTSLVEIVENYLKRIEENKALNAFLEVYSDEAIERAREIQQKISEGKAGKLAGMIIGIKDNICYAGHAVSAASHILEGFESVYHATAVERLLHEDAIIIGRLNCDEFAMGSSNENSYFGNVINPHGENRVPGGSSGGSAAAVAAHLCMATLGSDTGGSIRQPASFCGVVGLKPTYGRVSRHGLIAYASSFDQIGPLTHNIDDAALILEVIAGSDEFDSTASTKPVTSAKEVKQDDSPRRIAISDECLNNPGLDPEIKKRTLEIIEELKAAGHTVEDVDLEILDYLVPSYYVLTTAEASSNLSRYDGIHYGYRSEQATDIDSTYVKSRTEGFGEEVKRRIMLGTFVLSSGYYDAYYAKAQKARRIIRERTKKVLSSYDFILMPTTPSPAFEIGEMVDDPIQMYLQDIFTVQANLAGVPAISLPLGKHPNGMPFGIQLMADSFHEKELLAFSRQLMEGS